MENTKVYVVTEEYGSLYSSSSMPVAVFLSRKEADFYVWSNKRKSAKEESFGHLSFIRMSFCKVSEVDVFTTDRDTKEYQNFIADELKRIDGEIKEAEGCAEGDTKKIERLAAQKESLMSEVAPKKK